MCDCGIKSSLCITIVLGNIIILARSCSESTYKHNIGKCTHDKGLVQEYVYALNLKGDTFKLKTARGRMCLCNTNTCNDVPLKEFKKNTNITFRETTMSNLDVDGVSDTATDYIMSHTSSPADFVSIDNVTGYWMKYTSSRGATVKHTHASDRIQGISTVYSLTTRGLAAEQDKCNNIQLALIIAAVHYFKF